MPAHRVPLGLRLDQRHKPVDLRQHILIGQRPFDRRGKAGEQPFHKSLVLQQRHNDLGDLLHIGLGGIQQVIEIIEGPQQGGVQIIEHHFPEPAVFRGAAVAHVALEDVAVGAVALHNQPVDQAVHVHHGAEVLIIFRNRHIVGGDVLVNVPVKVGVDSGRSVDHGDALLADAGLRGIELAVHLFLQGIDAPVLSVDVQHAVFAALGHHAVSHLQAQVLAQLISDNGAVIILPGPDSQVGKFGNAAVEHIVVQPGVPIGAPEFQAHVLLGQNQAGHAAHGHAAADGKGAVLLVEGDASGHFHILCPVGIDAVELCQIIQHQADHRQAVSFVEKIAQSQGPAGEPALLHGDGPDDGGFVNGDGAAVGRAGRGGNLPIGSIIDRALRAQLYAQGFHVVVSPVRREGRRLSRDPAASCPVVIARGGVCKIEEAVFPVHAAVAALTGDVPQIGAVHHMTVVGKEEMFRGGIQREGGAGVTVAPLGSVAVADDQRDRPGSQFPVRELPQQVIVVAVRQIIVGKIYGLRGNIFDLHPVPVPRNIEIVVQEIGHHNLIDDQRPLRRKALLPCVVARPAVFKSGGGVQGLLGLSLSVQGQSQVRFAGAADKFIRGVATAVGQTDGLPLRQGKVGVQLALPAVPAGGKEQQPPAGRQRHIGTGPAQTVLLVGDMPAGQA